MLTSIPAGSFGPGARASQQPTDFDRWRRRGDAQRVSAACAAVAAARNAGARRLRNGQLADDGDRHRLPSISRRSNWDVVTGRPLHGRRKYAAATRVCVIGETVRAELFGAQRSGRRQRSASGRCVLRGDRHCSSRKGTVGASATIRTTRVMPMRTFQRRIAGNATMRHRSCRARDDERTTSDRAGQRRGPAARAPQDRAGPATTISTSAT